MANRNMQDILILAERYGSNKAIALSTVSLYASGQGRLMQRLQAGCGITVGRRDRILQWFSDQWPAELVWPEEISRPTADSPDSSGKASRDPAAGKGRRRANSRRVPCAADRNPVDAVAWIPARSRLPKPPLV